MIFFACIKLDLAQSTEIINSPKKKKKRGMEKKLKREERK